MSRVTQRLERDVESLIVQTIACGPYGELRDNRTIEQREAAARKAAVAAVEALSGR